MRTLIGSVLVAMCLTGVARAQATEAASLCWRPKVQAECRAWLVTELAVETPIFSTAVQRVLSQGGFYEISDFATRGSFTVGGMKNVRPDAAVGLTATKVGGNLRGRVEARYRRWRTLDRGVDLSAGYTGGYVPGATSVQTGANGLTGSIGISDTYFGADVRFDLLRAADGRNVQSTYLGVRAGSRAGPLIAVAGYAALIGLYFVLSSGGT